MHCKTGISGPRGVVPRDGPPPVGMRSGTMRVRPGASRSRPGLFPALALALLLCSYGADVRAEFESDHRGDPEKAHREGIRSRPDRRYLGVAYPGLDQEVPAFGRIARHGAARRCDTGSSGAGAACCDATGVGPGDAGGRYAPCRAGIRGGCGCPENRNTSHRAGVRGRHGGHPEGWSAPYRAGAGSSGRGRPENRNTSHRARSPGQVRRMPRRLGRPVPSRCRKQRAWMPREPRHLAPSRSPGQVRRMPRRLGRPVPSRRRKQRAWMPREPRHLAPSRSPGQVRRMPRRLGRPVPSRRRKQRAWMPRDDG